MARSIYARAVDTAAEILGGQAAVATYLGATPVMVASWAAGQSEPAVKFFLRLVDLIEQQTVKVARSAAVVRSKRMKRG